MLREIKMQTSVDLPEPGPAVFGGGVEDNPVPVIEITPQSLVFVMYNANGAVTTREIPWNLVPETLQDRYNALMEDMEEYAFSGIIISDETM